MKHAPSPSATQQERLLAYLRKHDIARAFELREIGVSATAISRAVEAGDVVRIGRGLYQAADAEADLNTNLAEVAKRAPRSVICLRLRTGLSWPYRPTPPQGLVCDWREGLGAVDRLSAGARRQVPRALFFGRHRNASG